MATEIGTRIKRARERRRWSQRQLAEALQVDRKTVDNWENGRTSPRSSIGAIEEVLGVRFDEPEAADPVAAEMDVLREVISESSLPPDRAARLERIVEAALRGELPPGRRGERREAAG